MYIASIPNRNSRPAVLLRQSYRENGKVKTRTLANLSHMEPSTLEALKIVLSKGSSPPYGPFEIVRSLPHGHVQAALHVAKELGLPALLGSRPSAERSLALALVVLRALEPASKASSARALSDATATSSLARILALPKEISPNDVYASLDWLRRRQGYIEKRLAKKHFENGCVVLYDLTSAWVEGKKCELARRGYSRDGKKGKDQIEFALLTDKDGRPISVEVFEGNVSDPATVAPVIHKLKNRFKLDRVVVVGDRGMLTSARIRENVEPAVGVDFVTGLRKPSIRKLLDQGTVQLDLFDDVGLIEIESDEFPGSRLVVCRNPHEAKAQGVRRQVRINRAVTALCEVHEATQRPSRALRGSHRIERRIGKVFGRHRGVEKYFELEVTEEGFTYSIRSEVVKSDARMDGMYIVRTSLPKEEMDAREVVRTYKSLAKVERGFRMMKSAEIEVRPIFHHRTDRVRAHVLLCMLALYLRRELESRLAPMLYVDEEPTPATDDLRQHDRSDRAAAKTSRHTDAQGRPIQSMRQAMRCLASLTYNHVQMEQGITSGFWTSSHPTEVQRALLEAVGISV